MATSVPPGSANPPGSPQGRPQHLGEFPSPSGEAAARAGQARERQPREGQARETADEMKDEARRVFDDAKDTARAKMGEQQRAAATGVGEFARALREAAHRGGERSTLASRAAETAADRLEQLSGVLKNKDLDSVVRDCESFARREPALFFGAAVAAGFIAMRLLKGAAPNAEDVQRRL